MQHQLLLTLSLSAGLASAQDATSLQGGDPYGMHFFDAQNGVITSDGGLVLRTADGGQTWTQATTPQSVRGQLKGVQFLDATRGFAVGSEGVFLKTIDGGATWTLGARVFRPDITAAGCASSGVAAKLHELFFFDELRGYVVGDDLTVAYTDNGGASWATVPFGGLLQSASLCDPIDAYDLHFWDEDEGVIVFDEGWVVARVPAGTGGTVLGSFGEWSRQKLTAPAECNISQTNLEFWSLDVLGETALLCGGLGTNDGYLFRGTMRGLSWTAALAGEAVNPHENCFSSPGYAPSGCGLTKPTLYGVAVLATTPSGSITDAVAVGYGQSRWERELVGPSDSCPSAPSGYPYWNQQPSLSPGADAPPMSWVERLDALTAFATGTFGKVQRIARSVDPVTGLHVQNVTDLRTGTTMRVQSSCFANAGAGQHIGFQGGQLGEIQRTLDGGASFELVRPAASTASGTDYVYGLDCSPDGALVVAVGSEGAFQSTGSGATGTWLSGALPPTGALYGVDLDDTGTRFVAVGAGGTVRCSDDGGLTWQALAAAGSADLRGVHFLTANLGVVAGDGGFVHYTLDGGQSWIPVQVKALNGALLTNNLRAVRLFGTLLVTVGDGGGIFACDITQSLTPVAVTTGLPAQVGARFNDVALGGNGLFVVGDNGVVLKFLAGQWTAPRAMTLFNLVGVDATNAGVFVSSRRSGLARF